MGLIRTAALAAALMLSSTNTLVEAQSAKCLACEVIFTLIEQLKNPSAPPTGSNPDSTCQLFGFCDGTCLLFSDGSWPAVSPVYANDGQPIDQRRLLRGATPREELLTVESAIAFLKALEVRGKQLNRRMDFNDLIRAFMQYVTAPALKDFPSCNGNIFNVSCEIHRVFDNHLPLQDNDNDAHAPAPGEFLSDGFRGASWRGRDCNDFDNTIYPGRMTSQHPITVDHNCNGIYGADESGNAYEELYCSGDNQPMGLAILGDSAAAHFHIPAQYVNAFSFNMSGILEVGANEADWPQCSWSTGFRDASDCPSAYGIPMSSIYSKMRQRNLCMHRDYQNIGVNGARTGAMAPPGIVNSYQRDQQNDYPTLVFYALIGNDVCHGSVDDPMTTPSQFETNVLSALAYLDTVLPAGSHVAFIGLADGTLLYNTTHTHTHPIGVSYPQLYSTLTCSHSNPCAGWLNTNETWRDYTSAVAKNLTSVYDKIIAENNYTNFDMYRVNVKWAEVAETCVATSKDPLCATELVDGFHPSQAAQMIFAEAVWNDLLENKPNWLPSINPNNPQIQSLFGNQGGY